MMKKILMFAFCLLMVFAVRAQEEAEAQQETSPTLLFEIGYQNALRYNDYATATTKLYDIIAFYPQDDSLKMDLAMLYYQRQMYPSALLVAIDVTKINPDYTEALELMGICYENLGLKDKSLESYEKLYLSTNDVRFLYKMIFLQYDLKKFRECIANSEILLDSNKADEFTVDFKVSETETKPFSYRVSVTNVLGLAHKEMGNIDKAKEYWNKALELAPDFVFAQQNLDGLK
jgi:tetratricopeptide (TPR) repeat protein